VELAPWLLLFTIASAVGATALGTGFVLHGVSRNLFYKYVATSAFTRALETGSIDGTWLAEAFRSSSMVCFGHRKAFTLRRAGHIADLIRQMAHTYPETVRTSVGVASRVQWEPLLRELRLQVDVEEESDNEDRLFFAATHPFPCMIFVNGQMAPSLAIFSKSEGHIGFAQILSIAIVLPLPLFLLFVSRQVRSLLRVTRLIKRTHVS
jgi:hypothetical protein